MHSLKHCVEVRDPGDTLALDQSTWALADHQYITAQPKHLSGNINRGRWIDSTRFGIQPQDLVYGKF